MKKIIGLILLVSSMYLDANSTNKKLFLTPAEKRAKIAQLKILLNRNKMQEILRDIDADVKRLERKPEENALQLLAAERTASLYLPKIYARNYFEGSIYSIIKPQYFIV